MINAATAGIADTDAGCSGRSEGRSERSYDSQSTFKFPVKMMDMKVLVQPSKSTGGSISESDVGESRVQSQDGIVLGKSGWWEWFGGVWIILSTEALHTNKAKVGLGEIFTKSSFDFGPLALVVPLLCIHTSKSVAISVI